MPLPLFTWCNIANVHHEVYTVVSGPHMVSRKYASFALQPFPCLFEVSSIVVDQLHDKLVPNLIDHNLHQILNVQAS